MDDIRLFVDSYELGDDKADLFDDDLLDRSDIDELAQQLGQECRDQ